MTATVTISDVSCPKCGCRECVRDGVDGYDPLRPRQTWVCKRCGRRFVEGGKYRPKPMVETAVNLMKNGLSTRETSRRMHTIYGVWKSNSTVSRWVRSEGEVLKPNVRLKPCPTCQSRTMHKHSCPEWKGSVHIKEQRMIPL